MVIKKKKKKKKIRFNPSLSLNVFVFSGKEVLRNMIFMLNPTSISLSFYELEFVVYRSLVRIIFL